MKVLVIGGTRFLGRHLVDAAMARGHEVTLFHRGRTGPDLFPELEHLHGDRERDLSALDGRRWDAVLDTCGYTPGPVRAAAELLRERVEHYTFISSISVYRSPLPSGADEDAPVAALPDDASPEVFAPERYGALKVLCERAVEEAVPGRALLVRAGLLVGPHDPTDRFTYWVRRIRQGGTVLAPGEPGRVVQMIHARDLSDWILRMVEERGAGVFNATGPGEPLPMGELLRTMRATLRSEAALEWVSEEFLLEKGVAPWTDLPLWLPGSQNSLQQVSIEKALRAGLSFMPLERLIRETDEWDLGRPGEGVMAAGMARQREDEVLRAWMVSRRGPRG
jgi:2'-hydroxyisoflavone reductase